MGPAPTGRPRPDPRSAEGSARLSAATTVVGVMGDPVAHSLSPRLHNAAFGALGLDWVSVAFRVPGGRAAEALTGMRALGLGGLSVTMPHKAAVADLVDELTGTARRLGAVNCIIRRSGQLVGDNTDGEGFVEALERGAGFRPGGRRCLVIGAGGAARAVVLALAGHGAREIVIVNRTSDRAEDAAALGGGVARVGVAEEATSVDLVVNATPVQMVGGPAVAASPLVDPDRLSAGQVVTDLVYHPLVTPWLERAGARGATTLGGLGMLVHQAALQITHWTGRPAPVGAMWEAASEVLSTG